MIRNRLVLMCFVVSCFVLAREARAESLTFSGNSGSYSASADFSVNGSGLELTLTNTSQYDVLVPGDVLTGVFFNLDGAPALTRESAVLAEGSTVLFAASQPINGVVGGEWAYNSGLSVPRAEPTKASAVPASACSDRGMSFPG